jgi:hypothetical protein
MRLPRVSNRPRSTTLRANDARILVSLNGQRWSLYLPAPAPRDRRFWQWWGHLIRRLAFPFQAAAFTGQAVYRVEGTFRSVDGISGKRRQALQGGKSETICRNIGSSVPKPAPSK